MFQPADLMSVKDAAGVVGEAPDGYVRLNGLLYQLPPNFPPDVAKEIVMVEIDTRNLKSVHVPQFRLEAHLRMNPKVYSQFQECSLKAGWDSIGMASMTVNPFSREDSKQVLTCDSRDVVEDSNEKLTAFKKPSSYLRRVAPHPLPQARVKAKAKANAKGKAKGKGKGKGKR